MARLGPLGFIKGYNKAAYAFTLSKDQLCDGQDVQVVYATLQKRGGSAKINSSALNSAAVITGLYDWLSGSTRYQLIVAGTKIYQTAALGDPPTDITGGTTITAGQNNQHTFASINGIVVICGGTTPDTPLQWTGTGNVSALAGSPPAGNLCVTANNFVFISGIAATPDRVFWSNACDPNTWGASQYVDFRKGDGDSVTAIADLNQNLVIFKRRSIGLLYTQTTTVAGAVTLAPLTQIPANVGAAGSQCWDHLPDGRIVFLGSDAHVYIFDGSLLNDISDPAYPAGNMQAHFDALPAARLPYACVTVYPTRHQVWFSVSTGSSTTNNQVYVYDYIYETWMPPFTGINANVMRAVVDTRSTPSHAVVLCTGTYGGFVTEQDKGTTNVEVADGHIDGYGTLSVIPGADQTDFEPKCLIVPYEAQTASTITNVNYGYNGYTAVGSAVQVQMQQSGAILDSTFMLDQSILATDQVNRAVIPIMSTGRVWSIQIQIRNQNPSQPFIVHPMTLSDEVLT